MRTPEEHLNAIRTRIPQLPHQRLPLHQAMNQVLAYDVHASTDSPRFDNSQMDGFALPRTALNQESTWPVGPIIPAGTDPHTLYPEGLKDYVAPIMTGAKVPAGTAAIVPVEHCHPPQFDAPDIRIPATAANQFIRFQGSDCRQGDILAPAGTVISPVMVGALASQDITEVEVVRRPRLLLCTAGEEIHPVGVEPHDMRGDVSASLPDANGPLLAALAQRFGMEVAGRIHSGDQPEECDQALATALSTTTVDAIITSGGISHGKYEVFKQVFGQCPSAWFGHVAQQPGGPQGLAEYHGIPVISLPGNPISTLVSFRLFVAPALSPQHCPPPQWARLITSSPEITGIVGKEQFRRAHLHHSKAGTEVEILGGPGSHLLISAAHADSLVRIPAGATLHGGDQVRIYPL
ncbi:molybdopterin molybdenumtransferase MoeA [Corynebacterium sp. 3HC-13]|uniref:molybdopterin molybdotransferase MoeA n=1 Tax=Corynebacterium poyangense TaxID=2684405 RepID=UPI001CCB3397|nr:molybdopterin molybdotransferase MoeA [Corynebacterium poyangense]MBZ8177460.1 molybdopterin molybdenumtransferase MoeA [Corynebacterium poyangense]